MKLMLLGIILFVMSAASFAESCAGLKGKALQDCCKRTDGRGGCVISK